MLDQLQFRALIIEPVLRGMSLNSQQLEDLLVGTCATESRGGTYIAQVEVGETPQTMLRMGRGALGIYQMEPRTHDDLWKSYLPSRPKLTSDMMQICMFSRKPESNMLIYNMYYSTAMAAIYYNRVQERIPNGLDSQADYYKTYWNTSIGASTKEEYMDCYNEFMGIKIKTLAKKARE